MSYSLQPTKIEWTHGRLTWRPSDETRKRMSEAQSGKNNPGWRGGTTKQRRRNHHSDSWWVRTVKERAAHSCELCGSTENPHSHHIIPYSEAEEYRLDLANGICLCAKCHRKVHSGKIVLQLPIRLSVAEGGGSE